MKSVQPKFSFWKSNKLPSILQTEGAECGLVCLGMLANYWGNMIDIPTMRRRFPISLKGMTLKGLIATASALNLHARPLKLDIQHIPELKLPCILHWDLNHFVVLKEVQRSHVVIHDPAVGTRKVDFDQLGKHFTGVALEITPTQEFALAPAWAKTSVFSLMGKVTGIKRGFLQILLLGIAIQLCVLVAPFYMQWVVDEALLSGDRELIIVLGIGFALVVLLQYLTTAVRSWCTVLLSTDINFQWYGNVFSHLLRLPISFFENRHSGDIISRFGSITSIQHGLTTQFAEGVMDGILALVTLIAMFSYNTPLTLVAIGTILVYTCIRLALFTPHREASAEQIIHSARQQTHFLESVRGIQSIRLFDKSADRKTAWMNSIIDQFNAEVRMAKLSISHQTANGLIFNLERVAIILFGAISVLKSEFSVGMLFAFISYKDQFTQRTSALVDKIFELRMLNLHAERLSDIVDSKPESEQIDVEAADIDGPISLDLVNVSFRYSAHEPFVLKNLNLRIEAGQCIAITGASGCGKTTLLKLLLGLLTPTEGEILVNGMNIANLGARNYRRLLGTVMQDDALFSGSIADNISFFDAPIDFERVGLVATLASVHDDITKMPMGYNTLVGDIGNGLSGGQKQRILLARALYKIPRLIVLDEATSHLDIDNESRVNEAIASLSLTRVLVAHRPQTIAMASRVVELGGGVIISDSLMATDKALLDKEASVASAGA